jgi:hypothetical protein
MGAFGLTVALYALMSLLNLVTNLFRPEYPIMYLVHTDDLDEVRRDGGNFSGMVATVDTSRFMEPIYLDYDIWLYRKMMALYGFGNVAVAIISLAIVGGSTGFRAGTDLTVQRSWILAWLIIGSVSSVYVRYFSNNIVVSQRIREGDSPSSWAGLFALPLWIPAIGGMVVVG